MATKKSSTRQSLDSRPKARGSSTSARATVSGPSKRERRENPADAAEAKAGGTNELAAAMPFNPNKAAEHGKAAQRPPTGATAQPPHPRVTASTLTESMASPKAGSGLPQLGFNPGNQPLDHVRTDSSGRALTTNLGVPIADNQNSLKAGLRGPALLEDFILREKITHFDHERIPERIVHARGSAAHGYFECYEPLTQVTRASLFSEARKRTPVFVRFSTVLGERGSAATCVVSRSSSTPTKATGTSSATTSQSSSSKTR
jgi:catalase